jgi:uncharacterized protein (DUF1810 family)
MAADPHNLQHFLDAQATSYDRACREIAAGAKQSHWIWYIFPQMRGLGRSPTAVHYGIAGRAEAEAYLAHPILGPRLEHITRLMLAIEHKPIEAIMPYPDDLKFHSSMTLFATIAGRPSVYWDALDHYFGGREDANTLRLLSAG